MSRPSPIGYLKKLQAKQIWDAASFSVQEWNKPLNATIELQGLFPLKETAGALIHSISQRINYWAPTAAAVVPWITVQTRSDDFQYSAICAFHSPTPLLPKLRAWLEKHRRKNLNPFYWFESRLPLNGQDPMRRHYAAMAMCCRSLAPWIMVRDGGDMRRLLEIVSPSAVAKMYLPLSGRVYEIASCIGPTAQRHAAEEQMPMLSAFDCGEYSELKSGFELAEYRDRVAERSRRKREEAEVMRKWPSGEVTLVSLRREEELKRLRLTRPTTWLRTWDCDWVTCNKTRIKLRKSADADRFAANLSD